MIFGMKEEKFIKKTLEIAYFERITKLEKNLIKARNKAEKATENTTIKVPRTGTRGGRYTSNCAKMDVAWENVRRIEKQIEILKEVMEK